MASSVTYLHAASGDAYLVDLARASRQSINRLGKNI